MKNELRERESDQWRRYFRGWRRLRTGLRIWRCLRSWSECLKWRRENGHREDWTQTTVYPSRMQESLRSGRNRGLGRQWQARGVSTNLRLSRLWEVKSLFKEALKDRGNLYFREHIERSGRLGKGVESRPVYGMDSRVKITPGWWEMTWETWTFYDDSGKQGRLAL